MSALPKLTAPMTGSRDLGRCATAFAHNLLVNTDLMLLDARAERILERLELSAAFLDLSLGAPRGPERNRRDRILDGVRACLERAGRKPLRPTPPRRVAKNLARLARLVGLKAHEASLLLFLVAIRQDSELRELASAFAAKSLAACARVLAAATNQTANAISLALQPTSRLSASGLISLNRNGSDVSGFGLKDGLDELLLAPAMDAARLLRRYLPPDKPSALALRDFEHLGEAPALVTQLLKAAVASRRGGINVLFYGAGGTGKTELARLVATGSGLRLHAAGTADDSGEAVSPGERLSSLLLGNRLLCAAPAALLFDKMEDLLQAEAAQPRSAPIRGLAHISKERFGQLLETNPVPTLWIANSAAALDPALLRRFSFVVEFLPLGARQRLRVLERHLGSDSELPPAEVRALADRYEVGPGQLGTAVAAARLLSDSGRPGTATLGQLLAPSEKLARGDAALGLQHFDAASFRLDALNAAEDLVEVADALASWRPGERAGLSLCLYGPPGTGKSEYAKYLAHRMGRAVVYRRVSDLLSAYVGDTEKNIARAFREAAASDALLLFDEADSFLRDRSLAWRAWEASQTNEFLQQLEAFRGVVVCTSNLWHSLDPASLRRFVFKVEFRFLRASQAAACFAAILAPHLDGPLPAGAAQEVDAKLARFTSLAPGDFAAVARRLKALGRRVGADEAIELLRREVGTKQGAPTTIGIRAG